MSAIFGEYLIFRQEKGPDVELAVFGDEFYARYETLDGFTVVYDLDLGLYCYADLQNGQLVSSATPLGKNPPMGIRRHLKDSPGIRNAKFKQRYEQLRPVHTIASGHMMHTIGPNRGLLTGRRVSEGPVRGLTVLVEFPDVQSTVTQADVDAMLNGANYQAQGNFCSVREYFRQVSNGKLDYTNVVMGPIRLSKPQAHYKQVLLVEEVMNTVAAQLGNDFSRFDSRSDGTIDAISFLYAGRTLYEGNLWPHNSVAQLSYGNFRSYFYMLTSMGRSPVDLSIGTFCHESSHMLCRFPDMYDYGERDGDFEQSHGIGVYCLMGSGNHLNRGRTPSPLSGYLRDLVGWPDNEVSLNGVGDFEIKHGDYGTIHNYATDKPNEYFIVENRSGLALDTYLPSSGLAVFHCDWLGSNEWQGGAADRHYQCGLLQADGHLDLEKNMNGGDAGDFYASRSGIALAHDTTPSSRQWDGAESGLIVGDIGVAGERITFRAGAVVAGPVWKGEVTADQLIPDNKPEGIASVLTAPGNGKVKSLSVRVSITHTYVGDIQVEVSSPSGKRAMLHNKSGGGGHDLKQTWTSASLASLAALSGETMQGNWTLSVRDLEQQDVGRLNWWGLEVAYEAIETEHSVAREPNLQIPDANPQGIQDSATVAAAGQAAGIKIMVAIAHSYRGDLKVSLVAPSGHSVALHNQEGGAQRDLRFTYDQSSFPALASLLGESIAGEWVLRVSDLAAIDTGVLEKWSLTLRV
ncbi:MAG: M6 family metalloprotease domain-containing protein [Hydrogenophilales bacterium]|nr:M6 family metalloprotease domain-containing protein [Hydrogenophilales bacterium]